MTWSIIARDESGAFGVAIATRFFAVGALCPHAESGVGALSTQALVNPYYGKHGLDLLRAGVPAPEVVRNLTAPDEGRDQRQLHVIDVEGRIGQHTGASCIEWCGAVAGDGFSVAGNMLAERRRDRRDGASVPGKQETVCRAPDRSAGSGRSRGRRQARQAVGGAARLLDRGLCRC